MKLHRLLPILASAVVTVGCGDDGTGLEAVDLEGIWTASVYHFTDNANPHNVVDIIQRDGASFTLTVDAAGIANTLLDDGLGSSSSDSGTLNSSGTTLTLSGATFDASRNRNGLTLTNSASQFDFGSGSSVAATLRITLNRS